MIERTWAEIETLAYPLESGLASSAMTITYGCGHIVFRVNGDAIHHTCPYCYVAARDRDDAA